MDDSLAASFRRATLGDSDSLPRRPDFGTIGQEITLRANFFPVHMSQGTLYDYDIAILPVSGTATYRMKKWILHLAEQTTEWRQAGMMDKVVHDDSKRLVSTSSCPNPWRSRYHATTKVKVVLRSRVARCIRYTFALSNRLIPGTLQGTY